MFYNEVLRYEMFPSKWQSTSKIITAGRDDMETGIKAKYQDKDQDLETNKFNL